MAPRFKDFGALILWLAEKHHDGAIYPMAARTGLSPAILDRWSKNNVKNPSPASLQKLCDAYGLDLYAVADLAAGRPSRRGLGKALAAFAFALSIGGVPAYAGTTNEPQVFNNNTAYRHPRRRLWPVPCTI